MKSVGRFKQAQVYVRQFQDVTVVVYNQETIYALPKHGSPNIIYHRFFGEIGTYPAWKLFRTSIMRSKRLTRQKIHSLAMKHGIQSFGTQRSPNLEGKKVQIETIIQKQGGK